MSLMNIAPIRPLVAPDSSREWLVAKDSGSRILACKSSIMISDRVSSASQLINCRWCHMGYGWVDGWMA